MSAAPHDAADTEPKPAAWLVYVLISTTAKRTYVGITNDLKRRLSQHNGEVPGGAKSTRGGRPWAVGVTHGPFDTRARAQQVEYWLKQRSGAARLRAQPPAAPPAPSAETEPSTPA